MSVKYRSYIQETIRQFNFIYNFI